MESINTFILASLPIFIIHIILMIFSLRILFKNKKTKILNYQIWVIIIIVINIFGSLAYLLWGKKDD